MRDLGGPAFSPGPCDIGFPQGCNSPSTVRDEGREIETFRQQRMAPPSAYSIFRNEVNEFGALHAARNATTSAAVARGVAATETI
ncbi:hypothetical protein LI328DRAFT_84572 [Trichoderma asperelloides]|nr:hypothetical protein LI328DRAFT_84572 [Trichoderma asperelloides]